MHQVQIYAFLLHAQAGTTLGHTVQKLANYSLPRNVATGLRGQISLALQSSCNVASICIAGTPEAGIYWCSWDDQDWCHCLLHISFVSFFSATDFCPQTLARTKVLVEQVRFDRLP